MLQGLIEKFRGRPSKERKGKAPEASPDILAPRIFFTEERIRDIETRLLTLNIVEGIRFSVLPSEHSSKVRVDFERGGQRFSAEFDVMKEPDKMTYDFMGNVYDARGKKIRADRNLNGLQHFEVSQAVITTFALAFSQEAS